MATTTVHGGHQHPAPHPAPHPHPHRPTAHKPAAKPKKGGSGRVMLILAALALAGAGLWIAFGNTGDGLTAEERLVKQIHDAATGTVTSPHTFNGELTVTRGERGLNITAKGIPSKACVSAAWRLAREGTVIVNGTLPMRISAGRLTELCAEDPAGSTITWVPEGQ